MEAYKGPAWIQARQGQSVGKGKWTQTHFPNQEVISNWHMLYKRNVFSSLESHWVYKLRLRIVPMSSMDG